MEESREVDELIAELKRLHTTRVTLLETELAERKIECLRLRQLLHLQASGVPSA